MLKLITTFLLAFEILVQAQAPVPVIGWKPNDRSRPQPPQITPASASTGQRAGDAPSDAIVLFNGRDLSQWEEARGGPALWKVRDGYMEVVPGSGSIQTRKKFGNCQLHVEWQIPDPAHGTDQDRGNSGVKLMEHYEIQVLDSYRNPTYADGIAGAVYSEYPPLVNPSLAPGQWQNFDIVFHAPRFGADKALLAPATATVIFNGVVVQDNVALTGPTGVDDASGSRPKYKPHAGRLPVLLQDHECVVRFRNVWVRELP
jgi:hypothetical protein